MSSPSLKTDWTLEELCSVDASAMVRWIKAIPFEDWPQQSTRELKPSMVTNVGWRNFSTHVDKTIQSVRLNLPIFQAAFDAYQPMLSVVMPGHSIEPHQDQQPDYWKYRVHVPLLTNPKAVMIMGGKEHNLKVGKAYKVNVRATHAIANRGNTPRIHFMFDVK